ncbi:MULTISPECIES: MFS transporter [Pediococcus]|uniref:Permease of the major facilitator superfamily n=1 Tax=Pediococcus pentosaceus (strain ATCC 25745 / CCUG 21536 / LMG 10740 / 183-1w) TaxID=278197 RepID=Q03DA0_PEDPA|nr:MULTISPECIES: MFS transporter [Pediococcus]ABJ68822.1 permease of the major facilitator superfamily [Pediococcus pentosaceus ATCC 25745]QHM65387.1 putative MFS-type transporter EfpA [Pediococcus pentosaceus]QHM67106.1 putative MFS-type transporter EfpA [Pediococcus pentosaceus]QHM68740.1 putative MFS-type transporter EfpA [Pediococcus pentosaceus]
MNKQKFGMILPIILISYFMILLDNSIVFTSTVKIAADLSLSASELSWVTNAYALTFGGLLMIGGRSGDIFGRRNVFLIGLVIFSIGSLLVGLSTNGLMIIAMRALQGIGSAILAPTTLALLMDSYRDQMRTRAIVYYGATGGLGASIGLVVGGLIASYASWRWGFLLNVPVGILMIVLTLKYIPASKKVEGKLDWLGSILSVLGITALVYGINGASHPVPMVMTGILLLVLFVWQEKVSKHPVTPLKLFKDRERSSAYIARFFFLGAMISYFFLTPQAMQQVYHFTPLMAAVGFLPETLPQFVFATLVSRLNEKFTNTQILIAGTVITLAGLVFAAVIGIQAGYWWSVAIPMVIIGIGQGFTLSPLTVAGVANTDKEIAGSASGVVNMVHQIGSSVGLSIITALTANLISPVLSYDHAIIIMAVFMLISVGATLNIGLKK